MIFKSVLVVVTESPLVVVCNVVPLVYVMVVLVVVSSFSRVVDCVVFASGVVVIVSVFVTGSFSVERVQS